MTRLLRQGGSELLEFALVLPLLLLLVFGVADFSLLLFDKAVVTNAAREGARAGVVFHVVFDENGSPTRTRLTDEQIERVVSDYCARYLVTFGDPELEIELQPQTAARASGETFTVRVEYPYTYVVLSKLIPGGLSPLVLSSTSVMRYE